MFKKVSIKTFADIVFALSVLNFFEHILIFFSLLTGIENAMFQDLKSNYKITGINLYILYPFVFVVNFLMVSVIYYFREITKILNRKFEFKNLDIAKFLNKTGVYLSIYSVIQIGLRVTEASTNNEIRESIIDTPQLILLALFIGLSMIRISHVLKISIQAKQDQDLTI